MNTMDVTNRSKSRMKSVPDKYVSEVTQAVIEDATLAAAADLAAAMASPLDKDLPMIVPETPEEEAILALLGVPYLGRTRAFALAAIGIKSLDDLHAASEDQIGMVKGIGKRNAMRIKEWLSARREVSLSEQRVDSLDVNISTSMRAEVNFEAPTLASETACSNQSLHNDLALIEAAIDRIKSANSKRGLTGKFVKQLERVQSSISEVPESLDTVAERDREKLTGLLDRIGEILTKAGADGKLSETKQEKLSAQVKARRKRLADLLGD